MQGNWTKRQKEQARALKRTEKLAKRAELRKERATKPARQPGEEDPDIAGIIPGPQPPLEV
jgi:hypothetical protein